MNNLSRNFLLLAAFGAGFCLVARAEQPARAAAPAAPRAQGKQVFDRWCASCHGDSIRAPGTTALAAKYGKDMPAPLEQRRDLTPEVVGMFVRQGVSIMPPFRKTEISDTELAALGRYLSAKGGSARR